MARYLAGKKLPNIGIIIYTGRGQTVGIVNVPVSFQAWHDISGSLIESKNLNNR
jgi:hypothetical protein